MNFGRTLETAGFRPAAVTGEGLADFFAEVFASLDERPRKLAVEIIADREFSIDLFEGEPAFKVGDDIPRVATLRGRWLAEHPVPRQASNGYLKLILESTTGNRVKVR